MPLYERYKTEIIFSARLILLGLYSIFTLYVTTNILSPENAALYLSLFAIVMFATVADSGFSSSIMHFVSKSSIFNESEKITQITDLPFLNLLKSVILVGLLLNIIFSIAVFLYIYMFVDVPITFNFLFAIIFFLYSCQIQVKALIEGLGHIYHSSLASLYAAFVSITLASVSLYHHKIILSICLFFIGNILIFLVKTHGWWFTVIRQSLTRGNLDSALLAKFIKHAFSIAFVWFFGYMNGYGTILIAKIYRNDEFVLEIGQLNMILVQLSMLLSIFLIPKQANFGNLWRKGQSREFIRLVKRIEVKTLFLLLFITFIFSITIVISDIIHIFLVSSATAIFGVLSYLLLYVFTFIKGTAIRYASGEYLTFWMPVLSFINLVLLIICPNIEIYMWSTALLVGSLQMIISSHTFSIRIR